MTNIANALSLYTFQNGFQEKDRKRQLQLSVLVSVS